MIYLGTGKALLNIDGYLHLFYKEGMIYRVEVTTTYKYYSHRIHEVVSNVNYSHWKHEVVSDVNECDPFEYVLPNTLHILRSIDAGDVIALYYELDDIIIDKILDTLK